MRESNRARTSADGFWSIADSFGTPVPPSESEHFMDRRTWLTSALLGSGAAAFPMMGGNACADDAANAAASQAQRGTAPLKIMDVKTILTAPAGIRLVVVQVLTNE